MRVLLDECLPRKVKTVPEAGWAGKKNGELLRLAKQEFDVFITINQNLQYQQRLRAVHLAVVLLAAPDNRLESLRPLMGEVQEALFCLQAGAIARVGTRGG